MTQCLRQLWLWSQQRTANTHHYFMANKQVNLSYWHPLKNWTGVYCCSKRLLPPCIRLLKAFRLRRVVLNGITHTVSLLQLDCCIVCVKYPQYYIRLQALGYLYTSCLLRWWLAACDWVMSVLSATLSTTIRHVQRIWEYVRFCVRTLLVRGDSNGKNGN